MNWASASGASSLRDETPEPADAGLSVSLLSWRGLRGRLGCGDRTCCHDQSEVAERLWEVADLPPTGDVVLLGEQAEIVGQPDEPLEQASRVIDAAVQCERADQPERAS